MGKIMFKGPAFFYQQKGGKILSVQPHLQPLEFIVQKLWTSQQK